MTFDAPVRRDVVVDELAFSFLISSWTRAHGDRARDLARGVPAHAVGDDEERELLVDEEVVLVVVAHLAHVGRGVETDGFAEIHSRRLYPMLAEVNERFSTRTTVRRPRVLLMWTTMAVLLVMFIASSIIRHRFGPVSPIFGQLPWWLIGPIIAAIQARPKIEVLDVDASSEGVRLGQKLIPRSKLKSALLRRESDKMFLLLRGGGLGASVDVQVKDDDEADALCAALALDAKSTTAEFTLSRHSNAPRRALVLASVITVVGAAAAVTLHTPFALVAMMLAFAALVALGLPLLVMAQRAKILVGADGLFVREGFRGRKFLSHDEIEGVSASGLQLIIKPKHGESIVLNVGSESAKKKQRAELELQAQSIVWRIHKAREAYYALAGKAPDGALALARGERSVAEWIAQLRRVGEGATATFRSMGLTRDQLLAIVESTSAAAKERIAAVVALHAGLTEEEKPRIRVAAERVVAPALRERMVRVADAESDEELAAALEEAEAISGDDADVAAR